MCTSAHHPQDMLYHEVSNPHQFHTELDKSAWMILDLHNFFDLTIGYVSASYRQYHPSSNILLLIPVDLRDGVSNVLSAITEQAEKIKVKHGCTPVLYDSYQIVVDGVYLIAKSNRFITLVHRVV